MLSSPLVGLRPLSMLRLEDCHYFAISAQSETFERIVYLSRYSIFSLSFPSLLYFSPVRPTFMKNHSHNARTYGGHCAILLSPLSKKGHAFFFLSFFFSFTDRSRPLRGFSFHPVNRIRFDFFFFFFFFFTPIIRCNFCTLNDYDGIVRFVERKTLSERRFRFVEYSDIF